MLATLDFSLWLSCAIMMMLLFFAWIYRFAFTLRFICKPYCDRLQVVRMFIAVVTIFAICWLPYHMFYVYAYHQPNITSTKNTPHLFLTFYWLAMSNSMVNPIIYYWMNRRFRHYFQRILCFCCFRLWKMDDTFLQRNSMSIERKPRLCKYFHFILIQLLVASCQLPNAFARLHFFINVTTLHFYPAYIFRLSWLWLDFKPFISIQLSQIRFHIGEFLFVFCLSFCSTMFYSMRKKKDSKFSQNNTNCVEHFTKIRFVHLALYWTIQSGYVNGCTYVENFEKFIHIQTILL